MRFTVVNIAVLVLRRDPVDHQHFRTPTILPILGAVFCAFHGSLDRPSRCSVPRRRCPARVGIVLWFVTIMVNRRTGVKRAEPDIEHLGRGGPVN